MEGRTLLSTLMLNTNGTGAYTGVLTYQAVGNDKLDLTISASNTGIGHGNTLYLFQESGPGVTLTPTYPVYLLPGPTQTAEVGKEGVNWRITEIDVDLGMNGGTVNVDSVNGVPIVINGQDINGKGASAALNVNDTSSGSIAYDISSTSISTSFGGNITYSGMSSVTVNDESSNSDVVFSVVSTAQYTPVTLSNGGSGDSDTFTVGNDYGYFGSTTPPSNPYESTLDGIRATVTIDGGPADSVNIDDTLSTHTNTYSVGSGMVVRTDYRTSTPPARIYYKGIGTYGLVTVDGGPVSDVFYAMNITAPTSLVGGAGGTTFGMFDASGMNPLHPLSLEGQSGHDWLNYNSYVGPHGNAVTVNLMAGTATGTAPISAMPAISGIANVLGSPGPGSDVLYGGPGNNVLVGGSTSTNVLVGGTGDDVMIGGAGTDILIAGGGYDLMIAGTTIYDYNLYQLTAIGTKWDLVNSAQSFQTAYTDFSSPHLGYYTLNTRTVTGNKFDKHLYPRRSGRLGLLQPAGRHLRHSHSEDEDLSAAAPKTSRLPERSSSFASRASTVGVPREFRAWRQPEGWNRFRPKRPVARDAWLPWKSKNFRDYSMMTGLETALVPARRGQTDQPRATPWETGRSQPASP